MRVALVQMTSNDNLSENLDSARCAVREAAEGGAEFIALPENFAFLRREGNPIPCAQSLDGEIVETVCELARQHRVPILAGTFAEAIEGSQRVYNTSALISETGRIAAVYRKIHLFDVDLVDKQESYRESRSMYPGDELVTVDTPCGRIGLTICYDVRFPEMFRHLVDDGATVFTVPAAFTATTGKAHWHVLLRARAIENLAYVIAPGQYGHHPDDRATFGHSLICDPWGRILAERAEGNGIVTADVDPELAARLRSEFPALSNRRLK